MQRIDIVNEWSFAKKLDTPYKGVFFFGKSAMILGNDWCACGVIDDEISQGNFTFFDYTVANDPDKDEEENLLAKFYDAPLSSSELVPWFEVGNRVGRNLLPKTYIYLDREEFLSVGKEEYGSEAKRRKANLEMSLLNKTTVLIKISPKKKRARLETVEHTFSCPVQSDEAEFQLCLTYEPVRWAMETFFSGDKTILVYGKDGWGHFVNTSRTKKFAAKFVEFDE